MGEVGFESVQPCRLSLQNSIMSCAKICRVNCRLPQPQLRLRVARTERPGRPGRPVLRLDLCNMFRRSAQHRRLPATVASPRFAMPWSAQVANLPFQVRFFPAFSSFMSLVGLLKPGESMPISTHRLPSDLLFSFAPSDSGFSKFKHALRQTKVSGFWNMPCKRSSPPTLPALVSASPSPREAVESCR